MTKEEITRMALEASEGTFWWPLHKGVLERFAELVAAAEREACAKVCESIDTEYHGEEVLVTWCAETIRARGEK